MTDADDIFLSYSRNDLGAANALRMQFEQAGIAVFKDDASIYEGDLWLDRLQDAVDACSGFVVLIGRDRVRRYQGAETQAALARHFGPHDDALRLPIFPILLADQQPETLPAFLRLFQATRWNGSDALPARLLQQVRDRTVAADGAGTYDGCPFVGLRTYTDQQAHLFFGRRRETLDALACFETRPGAAPVRWLEINGNSGSGKSSLMRAGLLPLIDAGWLWPRTQIEHWRRIGPMMPGRTPVAGLCEALARAFGAEMADVRARLQHGEDHALADWLRGRKADDTAFLLAIDQFEELFTVADADDRDRFDRLLATALAEDDCPLYVLSTVRADFLHRFDQLPALVAVRNRMARPWTLPPVSPDGIREIIAGPALLAGLDASAVQEMIVDDARGEPGALPLVENALHWLWNERDGNALSARLYTEQGRLAGILSRGADELLARLGKDRKRALELLFRLVNVDPDGRRHTRRRMPLAEAADIAGGGDAGQALIDQLASDRTSAGDARASLRLVIVTTDVPGEDTEADRTSGSGTASGQRWVNLIHETLIRAGVDDHGEPQPFWPALWDYIEANRHRAARRERLRLQAREWTETTGLGRLGGLAGLEGFRGFRGLATRGSAEARYLRWSRASFAGWVLVFGMILGSVVESLVWVARHDFPLEAIPARWADVVGQPPSHATLRRIPPQGASVPQPDAAFAVPFYLGQTEVTFEQYDEYRYRAGENAAIPRPPDEHWGRADRPVINVRATEAAGYAAWLGAQIGRECRLPGEAEWEFAARAGTTTDYALRRGDTGPWGTDDLTGLANCDDCGPSEHLSDAENGLIGWRTLPVGRFGANEWGLFDMHGNVWEWASTDPDERGSDRRVLRGGAWGDGQDSARSADRIGNYPNFRNNSVGFRVLCSSPIE